MHDIVRHEKWHIYLLMLCHCNRRSKYHYPAMFHSTAVRSKLRFDPSLLYRTSLANNLHDHSNIEDVDLKLNSLKWWKISNQIFLSSSQIRFGHPHFLWYYSGYQYAPLVTKKAALSYILTYLINISIYITEKPGCSHAILFFNLITMLNLDWMYLNYPLSVCQSICHTHDLVTGIIDMMIIILVELFHNWNRFPHIIA